MTKQTTKHQYVWICRYGLTAFPLVESVGPYDSDIDTSVGHAECIARRIQQEPEARPKHVYASPFLRCVHTASIIANASLENDINKAVPVRIEEGLTEWQVPGLLVEPNGTRTYPKDAQTHAQTFSVVDTSYKTQNPVDDKQWEDEEALFQRCKTTLEAILSVEHGENVVIVSHAPCDIALACHLEGTTTLAHATLPPWALGGLTRFCREVTLRVDDNNDDAISGDNAIGPWKMEFYGNTDHMPGEYQGGVKHWTLPSLAAKQA